MRSIIFFVATLAVCGPTLAMLSPYDPFEHMTSAAIEIGIGAQIDAGDEESEPLFSSDRAREKQFKDDLRTAVSQRLKRSGIQHDPESPAAVTFYYWGHSIPAGECGLDYVFLLEFGAFAEDDPHEIPTDAPYRDSSQGVIGTSSNEDLERALIDAAIKLLDEHLSKVDYARSQSQQPPVEYDELEGVSIVFDHLGGSVKLLEQRMGESGSPNASLLPGEDCWLRLRNASPYTIDFTTFSMYVRNPREQMFTTEDGSTVLALDDGMEISIAFGLLDAEKKPVRYTAIDMFWESHLPPNRSVLFNASRNLPSEASDLYVQYYAAGKTYRSHFPLAECQEKK